MSRSSQTFAPVQARTSFWEKVVAVFAWLWRHVTWSIWTTVIVGGFLVGVVLVSFVTKGTSGLNDPRTWVVIQPLLAHPLASTIGLIVLGIVILCAFLAYHHQKRVTRAEQQAYKALGGEHPVVATNLNNIALLYQFQGRHEEAERLYRQALAISMDVPGGTRAS